MIVWWMVAPVALALGMTLFNVWTWPRGRAERRWPGSVSVLIPARNEEASIGPVLDAVLGQSHPLLEVIVYDDGSTDGTAQLLAERISDPRLRVVRGVPLPDGWVGKPHACHRLAGEAKGDLLVFIDADVVLERQGVGRLVDLFDRYGAGLVTAVPHQRTGSWAETLVLPLLHLTYTSWLPLILVHRSKDVRFLAANGQILAITRAAYETSGGFEAVRADVVDDMALCRNAKRSGTRVVFADGSTLGACRMYESASGVWRGFSKNLFEGLGESFVALLLVMTLYFVAFVLPYLALVGSLLWPALGLPAATGVGLNVALRVALAVRYRHRWEGVILHPFGVALLLAIAVNSWRWSRRGTVEWAGRVYSARGTREARVG